SGATRPRDRADPQIAGTHDPLSPSSAARRRDRPRSFVLFGKAPTGAIREGIMFKPFIRGLLVLACMLPAFALAQQQTAEIDVPAGNLVTALDLLARQSGMQFVYNADDLA